MIHRLLLVSVCCVIGCSQRAEPVAEQTAYEQCWEARTYGTLEEYQHRDYCEDLRAPSPLRFDRCGRVLRPTVDFHDAHLEGAFLQRADLRGADLSGAHLQGARLEDADFTGAYRPEGLPHWRVDACGYLHPRRQAEVDT